MTTQNKKGFTLVEAIVSIAVLGICLLALTKAFDGITNAILSSKALSLGTNLAQEHMENLKQRSYFRVMVTTAPRTWGTTSILYDPSYYPDTTITSGGIQFTRLTHVESVMESGGSLSKLPSVTDTDVGMKKITIYALWTQKGVDKKVHVTSVITNPNTTMARSAFTGRIHESGVNRSGATVYVVENPSWRDVSDGSGNYRLGAVRGNYNIKVTLPGYFDQTRMESVAINATQAGVDFDMVKKDSGTVQGVPWINNHLVISKIVGSSVTKVAIPGLSIPANFSQEYVEIYNPTTWTWTMDGITQIGLAFERRSGTGGRHAIDIDYVSPSIAPGGFYLFANVENLYIAGSTIPADAYWRNSNNGGNFPLFNAPADPNIIPVFEDDASFPHDYGEGGIALYETTSNTILDLTGWTGGGFGTQSPIMIRENPILNQPAGLQRGEVFLRQTSTGTYSENQGPAYDSNQNDIDWEVPVISATTDEQITPRNTVTSTKTVVSGVPAFGAIASANDGLSSLATAVAQGAAPRDYAEFQLTHVATGTWQVLLSSNNVKTEFISTIVNNNDVDNRGNISLVTQSDQGYIAGRVTNIGGTSLVAFVTVRAGTAEVQTDIDGYYFLPVSTGTHNVSANADLQLNNYVSQTKTNVPANLGAIEPNVNFALSQGGRIKAYTTGDGVNPLPGVSIVAQRTGGGIEAQEITQNDGTAFLLNLSTGDYKVYPVLDSGETASPTSSSTTVTIGATIDVGTFTITDAFGRVYGKVTQSGQPIATGTLLIVTHESTPPVSISSMTAAAAQYYIGTSNDLGEYSIDVRGSTVPYYLHGHITSFNAAGAVSSTPQTVTGITVGPGQDVQRNVNW